MMYGHCNENQLGQIRYLGQYRKSILIFAATHLIMMVGAGCSSLVLFGENVFKNMPVVFLFHLSHLAACGKVLLMK